MKKTSHLTTLAYHLILLGLLLGIVSCSSVPSKSTQPRSLSSTEVIDKEERQGVEGQLLNTLSEARKLGPANPLLLSTMYSLASFYREHREYGKAEEIYQEAISLKEQVNGPEHQDIAIILHQYAALLRDASRVQEATELEHRARQIQASQTQHTLSRP